MLTSYLAGMLFVLGAATAITILTLTALTVNRLWRTIRYTRPGWWLHRHHPRLRPTR